MSDLPNDDEECGDEDGDEDGEEEYGRARYPGGYEGREGVDIEFAVGKVVE